MYTTAMSKFFVRVEKVEPPHILGLISYADDGILLRWAANTLTGAVEIVHGEGEGWEQKRDIAMVEIKNELARQSRG